MSDRRCLSEAQLLALSVLESGGSTVEAAATARVSRQTISAWCNHDSHFIAERNRRKAALLRATQEAGISLLSRALHRANELLEDADLSGVTNLLKVLNSEHQSLIGSVGCTTAGQVTNERAASIEAEFLATAAIADWAVFAAEDEVVRARKTCDGEETDVDAPLL